MSHLKTASVFLLLTLASCAYRSPEMYRDDTQKVLESKSGDIKACYDGILKGNASAGGKVTVNFDVETEGGKIQNVRPDKGNTNAPAELIDCVKKNIEGLVVSPPDKRTGQATFVYEFAPTKG